MLVNEKKGDLANEAFILLLEKPSLAGFPWEYVPIFVDENNPPQSRNISDTWQALPLLRSIPCSTPDIINETRINSVFFQFDINAKNSCGVTPHVLPDDVTLDEAKHDLIEVLMNSSLVHIACHGHLGCFSLKDDINTAFLSWKDIKDIPLPRIVLANCCHTAEAGDEADEWAKTLPNSFIRQAGAAVFCANLSRAVYSGTIEKETVFSQSFSQFYKQNESFTSVVYKTREEQSKAKDACNSQVIYIADNWNVTLFCMSILKNRDICRMSLGFNALPRRPRTRLSRPTCSLSKWWPPLYCKVLSALSIVTIILSRIPRICIVKPFENFLLGVIGICVSITIWLLHVIVLHRNAKKHLAQPNN